MKTLYILFLAFSLQQLIFSQSAQTYFPSQTGFKWTYKVTPLDSLNNPINTLSFYQLDSFAVVQNYMGRTANYVLSKSGAEQTINFQPYTDTTYLSFQSNDAFNYFKLFDFGLPFNSTQNMELSTKSLASGNNVQAFEGWFAYYKFAQNVNINYQIFSKDTTITFDTITFPIRYELRGRRLSDQAVTTPLGTFTCKRFLLSTVLSYLPIPILPIPLYTLLDTTYITQNNWIVKQVIPSSVVNLSAINLPTFTIPGNIKEAVPPLVVKVEEEESSPSEFYLSQNYPNPFNPSTKISWQSPVGRWQTIKVYDVLGNDVATLVDEYKPAGSYEAEFDAKGLASGIYFYTLRSGEFVQTKKMILLH